MKRCLAVLVSVLAVNTFAYDVYYHRAVRYDWISPVDNPRVPIMVESGAPMFFEVAASLRGMPEELTDSYRFFNHLGTLAAWGLKQELQNSDGVVRRRVPFALSFLIGMRVDFAPELKLLSETLRHADPEVRKNAALGMAYIASKAAPCSAALQSALSDTDADVRLAAAAALFSSSTATEETVVAMQASFANASPRFRSAALNSLIQSHYCMLANASLPVLRDALKDDSIAYLALSGFEKLGPLARGEIPVIQLRLKSEIVGIRYAAVRALRSIRQDQPDLAFFSKRALTALLRGDPRKQKRFLSSRFERDEFINFGVESARGRDRVRDGSIDYNVGTADYAIIYRRGFSMEFVCEDGAWKLLYINFSMC